MILADPTIEKRCHVYLLDLYRSKLPPEAIEMDHFYYYPREGVDLSNSSAPWYTIKKIGQNPLQKMVKNMCEEAGIKGRKTNHSLRATAATQLYAAGVPEKLIQERTGHRSLTALREYERTTPQQQKAVSSLLTSLDTTSYSTALEQQIQTSTTSTSWPAHAPTAVNVPINSGQFSFYNCVVNFNAPPAPTVSMVRGQRQVYSQNTQFEELFESADWSILDDLDL